MSNTVATEAPARFPDRALWRLALKHDRREEFTPEDHAVADKLLREASTAHEDMRERLLGQIAELRGTLGIEAENRVKFAATLDAAKAIVETWANQQGHARCFWHPDTLTRLADTLGVPVPEPILPPRSEFEAGCRAYADQQYGGDR